MGTNLRVPCIYLHRTRQHGSGLEPGLSVDLSEIGQALSAVSSVAVIVGVVFIVFQLRQNNRLIEASKRQVEANLLQVKSNTALGLVERFTDYSFTRRRKTVREIVRKYGANDWKEFIESSEDFEVRAFCSFYEFAAVLARKSLVELQTLMDTLGYRAIFDWEAVKPVAEFYRKNWKVEYVFTNFEWLAEETRKYLETKERELNTLEPKMSKPS